MNSLRLMYSRLASHRCPNGHYIEPTLKVAAEQEILCPMCGEKVHAPSEEELAFNSQGACQRCCCTGSVRTVDFDSLVPDDSLSIDEGAVAPWNSLMWSLMTDVCREMGVRTDVPFRELTEREKNIVFHGPAEKKHIFYHNKNTGQAGDLDFTYFNAVYTVENALSKVKDEKGMKRVEKFLKEDVCPDCHGTRLSSAARAPRLRGISLDEACTMSLTQLVEWVKSVPSGLPEEMRPMAESICEAFQSTAKRLMDLGLGYLTLDRSASTRSTGERQRMLLARAVRNRTTGVLYVLDEPSIGLHPSNIVGPTGVMHDLVADGNSVILVDHDTQILKEADWIVEMGPEAGAKGGYVIAQGAIPAIEANSASQIGPFLAGTAETKLRCCTEKETLFANGTIHLSTDSIHTVKPLEVDIPKGRLTVVTSESGTGKTTTVNAILSLYEALYDRVALCAPTGRAAKRLSELTNHAASTIHRLLEVDYSSGSVRFIHNEKNLLKYDVIILDEMSMVDVKLFQALLAAARYHCRIIMVGDADQLPSVGPGNILGEILKAGVVPTVRLTDIFRQAQRSLIVQNAHRIVEGQMPQKGGPKDDFFLIESNGLACQKLVCDLVSTRLPKAYGFDPVRDIQVLCPTKVGPTGSVELNRRLQDILNPPAKGEGQIGTAESAKILRLGDKVMQVKNDYDITFERAGAEAGVGAYNGDLGIITAVDVDARSVTVQMDDKKYTYTADQLNELAPAYAVTVHKSQGSEFPAVILPVADVPARLCYRNLLYTGVTRARKLCVLTGTARTEQTMVENVRQNMRYSGLRYLLKDAATPTEEKQEQLSPTKAATPGSTPHPPNRPFTPACRERS